MKLKNKYIKLIIKKKKKFLVFKGLMKLINKQIKRENTVHNKNSLKLQKNKFNNNKIMRKKKKIYNIINDDNNQIIIIPIIIIKNCIYGYLYYF